jgi:hypothetical protein
MSWPGQVFEHYADHCEAYERCGGTCITLEVAGGASVTADPGEGSLDDPPFGQDDEAMPLVALDDFQRPGAGLGDSGSGFGPLVSGIGEDALDEREKTARAPIENERGAIAILQVGRVNDDLQQEAQRVDENMPFAARDLLARIEALRVERGAPF